MRYNKIPKTELSVSAVSLGTWVFGGDNWSGSDENTAIQTVRRALEEGKIRCIGVSNFDLGMLKKAASICRISTIQNEYSFLKRDAEKDILPWCLRENTGFLAYGPLGGGILTGKYKTETKFPAMDARSFFYRFYSGKDFKRADKAAEIFRKLGKAHKKPASQIAINWVAGRPGVTSAIAGARTAEQAQSNAQSADLAFREKEIELLTAINV